MPFTPTHIAAAIPIAWLCRWKLPFTALAVGTMVPDVGIYFPSLMDYTAMHSGLGVLTRGVPVGLLFYYIYASILKRPLIDLFPEPMRSKLLAASSKPSFDPLHILVVAVLLAIGGWTHVLWDSFTHNGRWGTETVPALKEIAFHWGDRPIRWYALMQHGSSIMLLPPMMFAFLIWVWKQPNETCDDHYTRLSPKISWPIIGIAAACIFAYWLNMEWTHKHYPIDVTLRLTIRDTGAVCIILTFIYAIAMQFRWLIQGDPIESRPRSPSVD